MVRGPWSGKAQRQTLELAACRHGWRTAGLSSLCPLPFPLCLCSPNRAASVVRGPWSGERPWIVGRGSWVERAQRQDSQLAAGRRGQYTARLSFLCPLPFPLGLCSPTRARSVVPSPWSGKAQRQTLELAACRHGWHTAALSFLCPLPFPLCLCSPTRAASGVRGPGSGKRPWSVGRGPWSGKAQRQTLELVACRRGWRTARLSFLCPLPFPLRLCSPTRAASGVRGPKNLTGNRGDDHGRW